MSVDYGTLSLTVTSPIQSFTEPITLAQAQHFLGVPILPPVEDENDALIEMLIAGARGIAEIYQRRDLVRKQYDLSLDSFVSTEIPLRPELVSVDLVTYKDSDGVTTTLTEGTDYIVDTAKQPGLIVPPYGKTWPSFTAWPSSAVLVRFTCGLASTDAWWAGDGQWVLTGMKHLISHWYNGRLPYEAGVAAVNEYPMTVALLSWGAVPAAR